MTAATTTLPPIEKYATYNQTITWMDGTGAGVNVSNCYIAMMLKAVQGASDIVLKLATTNGRIVLIDPANGIFQLLISASDTSVLAVDTLAYDLVVTFPNGVKTRLLQGVVEVVDGVTYE